MARAVLPVASAGALTMTPDPIRRAVQSFLALIGDAGSAPTLERENALRVALDRLAFAYHSSSAPEHSAEYPDPPRRDPLAMRARIARLFPELGYYNVALDPEGSVEVAELAVGDAIDDITDIALDLFDVSWRFENTSERDALWAFRFGFETHWGKHLRELQLYLHHRAT